MSDDFARFGLLKGYANLPDRFYARVKPTPVRRPNLIQFNRTLALQLNLNISALEELGLAAVFSGNTLIGSDSIAMAYAGHQFGHFVPQLGDGRAILLGEAQDREGIRREIQLKGSGRTPYSRNGDGRAALGPVLREYLLSEAMYALGVPGTRALAAVTTGEWVAREAMVPGAIFTRVALSHVRVGSFQFFAARADQEGIKLLADYVINRHYPELKATERPYLELLRVVGERQASLIARWMHMGFIHGVMNTDNMTLSGETIDFGPCAFLDSYDPATVYSSIDSGGRYSYENQPHAAQWNLARLAETLLPLISSGSDSDSNSNSNSDKAVNLATSVIEKFPSQFEAYWLAGMRVKLGLVSHEAEDLQLARDLLIAMHHGQADFTRTFRRLCDVAGAVPGGRADTFLAEEATASVRTLFSDRSRFDDWLERWRIRLERELPDTQQGRAVLMRAANPAFIPRNHRVERVIRAALEHEDFQPFEELLTVLSSPYTDQAGFEDYSLPPRPEERVLQTFCGT